MEPEDLNLGLLTPEAKSIMEATPASQGGAAVPGRYGLGGRGMGAGARGLPLPLPAFLQCSLGTCWAPGSAWMPGVMGSWRTACASPRGLTIDPEMDLTP